MDKPSLETDQPGVILVTTDVTSHETAVHFTQIFHCIDFQGSHCREFGSDISSHHVTFKFQNWPVKQSDLYSFHVLYDEQNEKFNFKFYSYSNSSLKFEIKEEEDRTIILIRN